MEGRGQAKESKAKDRYLIVLSPANAPGSRKGERNVELYRDLNRSFPGGKKQDDRDFGDLGRLELHTQIQPPPGALWLRPSGVNTSSSKMMLKIRAGTDIHRKVW